MYNEPNTLLQSTEYHTYRENQESQVPSWDGLTYKAGKQSTTDTPMVIDAQIKNQRSHDHLTYWSRLSLQSTVLSVHPPTTYCLSYHITAADRLVYMFEVHLVLSVPSYLTCLPYERSILLWVISFFPRLSTYLLSRWSVE